VTESHVSADIDVVDFFTDNRLLHDPYEYLAAMRRRCPVRREPFHDVVMVTGYEEAVAVYNDNVRFSSCTSVTGPFPGFPVPLEGDDVSELIDKHRRELPFNDQLPSLDPPVHTDHRALLSRMITPKRLRENEEFMRRLADRQYDEALAGGGCEFVAAFANPFAMLVIADLLGVPESDHDDFKGELLNKTGMIGSGGDAMHHSPLAYLYGRFTDYITERRENPRDDVLTGLAAAVFSDGSTPPVADVVCVAANLFAAGQETTVRLLSTAVQFIAEDPALQARPNPDSFDIERSNARNHIAFGRGAHSCPGLRWPAPRRRSVSIDSSTAPRGSGSTRTTTVPLGTGDTATCPPSFFGGWPPCISVSARPAMRHDRDMLTARIDSDRLCFATGFDFIAVNAGSVIVADWEIPKQVG